MGKRELIDDALPGGAAQAGEPDGGYRQFVTFRVGGEVFGVPIEPVKEIIRLPRVVHMPLSPPSLLGLANLRGGVLPVVDLRTLLGLPPKQADDATRVLVIQLGQPMGFVVDQVARVVSVGAEQIEGVETLKASVDSEVLSGVLKGVQGHAMVMLLDFQRAVQDEFAHLTGQGASAALAVAARSLEGRAEDEPLDQLQLVSFQVDGQEYACAIEQVKEIVQVPETVTTVPHVDGHVLGVITLRNRLLPLISLRRLFGLAGGQLEPHQRIVVVSLDAGRGEHGRATVGVVVDGVNEVLRVERSLVEELPATLSRRGDLGELASICRLEEGKRLVSILAGERLFAHRAVLDAVQVAGELEEEEMAVQMQQAVTSEGEDRQLVVFRLGKDEFGVSIEAVKEIVRVPEELTRVPRAPSFIEGVINLRGSVLPVVDQRRRFGLPDIERNDRQRIIVFALDGVRTGFIVDTVTEVRRVPAGCLEPAPRLSAEQGRLIGQVANLEDLGRMILLLDARQMLAQEELEALAEVEV